MDDYIPRSIAIAKLTKLEVTEPLATLADAKRLLADMPAADVAPVVHGHWIMEADGGTRCSVCGQRCRDTIDLWEAPVNLSDMPYCPKCGAEMEEE